MATRKEIEKKLAAYDAEIAHLESDSQKGEGKKELAAKAKDFEKDRDTALKQDPYFDYAQAFLQIGVVLASASIVLKNSSLLWGSGFLEFSWLFADVERLHTGGEHPVHRIKPVPASGVVRPAFSPHPASPPPLTNPRLPSCHERPPGPSNPPDRDRDGPAGTHRKARHRPDPP